MKGALSIGEKLDVGGAAAVSGLLVVGTGLSVLSGGFLVRYHSKVLFMILILCLSTLRRWFSVTGVGGRRHDCS